jgi:hypothetical protein
MCDEGSRPGQELPHLCAKLARAPIWPRSPTVSRPHRTREPATAGGSFAGNPPSPRGCSASRATTPHLTPPPGSSGVPGRTGPGACDAWSRRMRSTNPIGPAAVALAAVVTVGCTRESSRGPVGWAASAPSSPAGQTVAQSWSRSTSNDRPEPGGEAPRFRSIATVGVASRQSVDARDRQLGVANAQPPIPPIPKWPYDGVTVELGTTPQAGMPAER